MFYKLEMDIDINKYELLFLSLNQFITVKRGDKNDNKGFCFPNWCKVSKLKDKLPLSYNDSMILVYYLNLQQELLERKGYGFFILAIEDIVVIEADEFDIDSFDIDSGLNYDIFKFAYLNPLHIKKINKNNEISLLSPFSVGNGFCAPEILAVKSIPCAISYKCFYYSLGALIIYCISNGSGSGSGSGTGFTGTGFTGTGFTGTGFTGTGSESGSETGFMIGPIQLGDKLELIKGTKLYWLVKRLIVKEPKDRLLLFA